MDLKQSQLNTLNNQFELIKQKIDALQAQLKKANTQVQHPVSSSNFQHKEYEEVATKLTNLFSHYHQSIEQQVEKLELQFNQIKASKLNNEQDIHLLASAFEQQATRIDLLNNKLKKLKENFVAHHPEVIHINSASIQTDTHLEVEKNMEVENPKPLNEISNLAELSIINNSHEEIKQQSHTTIPVKEKKNNSTLRMTALLVSMFLMVGLAAVLWRYYHANSLTNTENNNTSISDIEALNSITQPYQDTFINNWVDSLLNKEQTTSHSTYQTTSTNPDSIHTKLKETVVALLTKDSGLKITENNKKNTFANSTTDQKKETNIEQIASPKNDKLKPQNATPKSTKQESVSFGED
jgi:archaellum component FlaC